MRVQHLVDTDWVIHYLNGHAGIVRRLREQKSEGLGLSVVSRRHFEMVEGLRLESL